MREAIATLLAITAVCAVMAGAHRAGMLPRGCRDIRIGGVWELARCPAARQSEARR